MSLWVRTMMSSSGLIARARSTMSRASWASAEATTRTRARSRWASSRTSGLVASPNTAGTPRARRRVDLVAVLADDDVAEAPPFEGRRDAAARPGRSRR